MKKRILALLLSVMMVVTLLPSAVFANNAARDSAAAVSVTKTAEWTDEQNGIAKVTLTVNAQDGTATETQVSDTYIVLVLDRSGSMSNGGSMKMANAKAAAKDFVDKFLPDYASNVKIGVVSYAGDVTVNSEFTTNKDDLNSAIDQIRATGGTNIQLGIKTAQDMLAEVENKNAQKIIVVLTDGDPTYSYKGTQAVAITDENNYNVDIKKFSHVVSGFNYSNRNRIGDGSDYSLEWYERYYVDGYEVTNNGVGTVSEAYAAKAAGTTIYSIGYGISDGSYAETTMKSVASAADKYYAADSESAIANVLGEIASEIESSIMAGTDASINDPMGSAFDVYVDSSYPIEAPEGDDASVDED
ncbi:MAG: VWA domain-containing protein, partial [Clostridia bacterium]|nr:VWA domain-containing protein [Clostridia bacterium]